MCAEVGLKSADRLSETRSLVVKPKTEVQDGTVRHRNRNRPKCTILTIKFSIDKNKQMTNNKVTRPVSEMSKRSFIDERKVNLFSKN